ncbi:SDR family NAD(P)-dependent oxidoreductase, partial [Mesorhizobium sp. M0772]|uniref:SDR family NAD(P)-dependent oxidoreductase n=1 Tax=Mesorhizobium sp. M0772 TaxID=2956998 RepID=UPI00333A018F
PGMAGDLYRSEPAFRTPFDRCADIISANTGEDLRAFVSPQAPPPPFSIDLPLMFATQYAMASMLIAWGVRPAAVLGYSLGEYVAATVAETLSLEAGLDFCCAVGRGLEGVERGAMLAVAATERDLQPFLNDLTIAAVNADQAIILSGPEDAARSTEARLESAGIICRRLNVRHAFHSPRFALATSHLTAPAHALVGRAPSIAVYSCAVGGLLGTPGPDHWIRPLHDCVRFQEAADVMLRSDSYVVVELGPGPGLSALLRRHPQAPADLTAVPVWPNIEIKGPPLAHVLGSLGRLWLAGATIEWSQCHPRGRNRVSLPGYSFEHQRHWVEAREGRWEFNAKARGPEPLPGKKIDPSEWTYQPSWVRDPAPLVVDRSTLAAKGPWLVVEGGDAGKRLMAGLRRSGAAATWAIDVAASAELGHSDVRLAMDSTDAWLAFFAGVKPRPISIVFFCDDGSVGDRNEPSFRGFHTLVALAKALDRSFIGTEVSLRLVGTDAFALNGQGGGNLSSAALFGAARVIAQENLSVATGYLDVAATERLASPEKLNDWLLDELVAAPSPLPTAFRKAERWRQRLDPLPLARNKSGDGLIRQSGVYMITGGFGKVARVLSRHLAKEYGARLILVGHQTPQGADSSSDLIVQDQIRHLRELEALGAKVVPITMDVSDRVGMRETVGPAVAHFGGLNGILHTAGNSRSEDFRPLREISRESCERHFHVKVQALQGILDLASQHSPEFVMLFSSLAAVLGGLGFVGYSAANAALDAFAAAQCRGSGPRWTSVNWDTWNLGQTDGVLGRTIADLKMDPNEGIEIFQRVLTYLPANVIVSTGDLGARMEQWVRMERNADASLRCERPSLPTDYEAPQTDVEKEIAMIWHDIFGISTIGRNDNFLELGGHSLMAVKLVSRLRRLFKVDVPLTVIFDAPTILHQAVWIEEALLQSIESLTEEEAESLLATTGSIR